MTGKLVRDRVPEIIKDADGTEPYVINLRGPALLAALFNKMVEELDELGKAVTRDEQLEELADVYEVTRGLTEYFGFSWDGVEIVATHKLEERGGFYSGTFLFAVD